MIFKVFSIYFLICFLIVGQISNSFQNSKIVETLTTIQK